MSGHIGILAFQGLTCNESLEHPSMSSITPLETRTSLWYRKYSGCAYSKTWICVATELRALFRLKSQKALKVWSLWKFVCWSRKYPSNYEIAFLNNSQLWRRDSFGRERSAVLTQSGFYRGAADTFWKKYAGETRLGYRWRQGVISPMLRQTDGALRVKVVDGFCWLPRYESYCFETSNCTISRGWASYLICSKAQHLCVGYFTVP